MTDRVHYLMPDGSQVESEQQRSEGARAVVAWFRLIAVLSNTERGADMTIASDDLRALLENLDALPPQVADHGAPVLDMEKRG